MCSCGDIVQDDPLEIAARNPAVVKENVVAMVRQILKNGESPSNVDVPITYKDGFLDTSHAEVPRSQYQHRTITNKDVRPSPRLWPLHSAGARWTCSRSNHFL